ncbi:fimbrial protein [Stenotrophomonas maltophilia]|uniref:fimbrial protein n=1 Tax=Stenotrophomonas maltophilia TaxID=40324 RepID=UPI0007F8ED55|nr:fimbrial protein [Stenotrophomonas maltophilia]OBU56180.1 hypothetical protein A9K70_16860 [Stenotrophomonas maltophilia]
MNKLALALSAALSLGAVASASAADATITFTGEIKAMPCTITLGSDLTTLRMPTITPGQIADDASRDVPFELKMGNTTTPCPANTYTLAFNDSTLVGGKLVNSAASGAATNVVLAIAKAGVVLDLSTEKIDETLTSAGIITIPLSARLDRAAAGTIGEGTYSGNLLINVTY